MAKTAKNGGGTRRSTSGMFLSGAATVTLDQRMRLSRNRVLAGSVLSDGDAIRGDFNRAMRRLKRELEAV